MSRLEVYGLTHAGHVRAVNEDAILLGRFVKQSGGLGCYLDMDDELLERQGLLVAVADGIGGGPAGALASDLALRTFERQFASAQRQGGIEALDQALTLAANRANAALLEVGARKPEVKGLGCTVAGICWTREERRVFSAGDSRVYRWRHGVLKALTHDDTLDELAAQAGLSVQHGDQLMNFIGTQTLTFHLVPAPPVQDGDLWLVCSDGLTKPVDEETIERTLDAVSSLETLAKRLLTLALQAGGPDNISLILIALRGSGEPSMVSDDCSDDPRSEYALFDDEPAEDQP